MPRDKSSSSGFCTVSYIFVYKQPVKKKKNKKKGGNSGNGSIVNSTDGNNIPASPESVSSEAGSATGFLVNGDNGKLI